MTEEFQIYKEIGNFAKNLKSELLNYFTSKDEFTDLEIVEYIEKKIKENYNAAFPAIVGYREIITHSTALPTSKNIINPKKEIIRIDFGIKKDGYLIDNAYTYNLCNDEEVKKLTELFELFFKKIELLQIGENYNKIGKLVEEEILEKWYF